MKGTGYVGAIAELEQFGVLSQIEEVAGTSVGGLIATLVAIGCSPTEIREFMLELNFKAFQDKKETGWLESPQFEELSEGVTGLGKAAKKKKNESGEEVEAEKGKLCLQWVENVNFKPVYIPASTEIVKGAIKGASIPYNFGENENFKFEPEIGLKLPLDLREFGISSKLGAEKKGGVRIIIGIPMKSDKEYKIYLAQVAIKFTKPGAKLSDVKGFIVAPEAFQEVIYEKEVIPKKKP